MGGLDTKEGLPLERQSPLGQNRAGCSSSGLPFMRDQWAKGSWLFSAKNLLQERGLVQAHASHIAVTSKTAFSRELGIELFAALRTDAMRKSRLGVLADVGLELVPGPFFIANFLASRTDRQQAAEYFDTF